jgi:hypothetical protein
VKQTRREGVACSCAALRSCVLAGRDAFIMDVCIRSLYSVAAAAATTLTHLETGKWQVNAAFIYLDLLSTHHTDPPFFT